MNRAPAATLQALLRQARRGADRLGLAGVVGIALLASCAGYYAAQVHPLRQHLAALRATDAPPRQAAAPSALDTGDRLRTFAAGFPDESEVAPTLATIYRLADREGLRFAQGEYRFVRADALGLVQYQIILPVTGTYPQLRALISAVLENVAWAAVTQVQVRRERVARGDVEARIGLTLHLRAGGTRAAFDSTTPARVSATDVDTKGALR